MTISYQPRRAHIFRLKHIVDRADGIALGTGRAGLGQPLVVDMVGERRVADLNAGFITFAGSMVRFTSTKS